ncbi:glycoside hydrolase family 79 protein [Phanerochaete carnosa HHB-10118-sp]|uniref:Glycoside hydrolase family 79 protein n=1 Tax=Phanerochaete carnosa (strain HHB-10118-sp) TaxID=650164 RepID=K5WN27_PHACS|nr:glycoside hydrolase family 79 protein [Phanerochaete carnosa HHB-10118-sp]EKM60624.1 glycoside hydrolase family 79 protein [Phanerochaete carnosa HHB-10118-sp]
MSYNLLEPPPGVVGGAGVGGMNTNTNFYVVLAVAGALVNANGSRVDDLGSNGSQSDYSAVHAGYTIYDQAMAHVRALALFNHMDVSAADTDFTLPAALFPGVPQPDAVLVRHLGVPHPTVCPR